MFIYIYGYIHISLFLGVFILIYIYIYTYIYLSFVDVFVIHSYSFSTAGSGLSGRAWAALDALWELVTCSWNTPIFISYIYIRCWNRESFQEMTVALHWCSN